MTKNTFRVADLFCGAGGTSAGAIEALEALGYHVELTAVNHWPVAIDTHTANHPGARHLCTGIDSVNPLDYFERGELDMLWASPECTHHSIARGGKPINDQSRSTAWHVLNWAEKLEPNFVLLENVPEWEWWGPLDENNRPIKSLKGKIFRAMLSGYRAVGYKLMHGLFCAADYGDPTTRTRLFVVMVRGKCKISGKKLRLVLPRPTHARNPDLFTERRWTPARDIIDWDLPAGSIFERKRPLSPKTLARIEAGLRKFGLKGFIVPQFGERAGQDPRTHDLDQPAPAVTSHGAGALVQPFIVPQCSNPTPKSVDEPLGTVLAEGSGPKLVQPSLVQFDPLPDFEEWVQRSEGGTREQWENLKRAQPYIVAWDHTSGGPEAGVTSIDDPLSTVVTKARHGVAEPFLIPQHSSNEARSVDKPVPTVTTTSRGIGLAQPFLVKLRGTNDAADIEQPVPTVTAGGTHLGLAEPFLVNMKGQSDAADIDQPAPTITAHAPHLYMAEPFLVKTANGESRAGEHTRAKSLDDPMPTLMTSGDVALVEPFLIKTANGADAGDTRVKSLDEPMPTVCGNRGDVALIEPCLLGQQSCAALRPISEPAPTVSTAGAIALVEPFLVSYYGNGQPHAIGEPTPTVTCKDRLGLVRPVVEIDGSRYLLDIRFRMLQPHELALAQGFPAGYKFTGTKTDQVKQIGNAVPRRLARALVAAAVSQCADVGHLVDAEEGSEAAA